MKKEEENFNMNQSDMWQKAKEWCRNWCEWDECKKWIWHILGAIVLLWIIWALLGRFGIVASYDFPKVSKSQWQAVFLTNNQVYFGHLKQYNRRYVKLSDVYYLQAAQALQQGEAPGVNATLVKLGSELHGPEDIIYIPKDKILFWENMRNDSQVVRGIESTRK